MPAFALLGLDIEKFVIYYRRMTKLHIDLINGVLEIDGEEEFVRSIYNDFKEQLVAKRSLEPKDSSQINHHKNQTAQTDKKAKRTNKAAGALERYALIKDLDFTKGEGNVTLKDYYKQKDPKSYTEKNLVFVYFLKNKLKVSNVNLDHIYTAYDEVGSRRPNAFRQSVADTSSKKGWLDTSSYEDIKISIKGQNYVDHDLPAKETIKK